MPSRRNGHGPVLVLVFAILVLSQVAARAGGGFGPTTLPPPRMTGQVVALPRGRPMPDSVLAWVGERREVSISGFRRAWGQVSPPARPDSLTPQTAGRFLDLLIDKEVLAEHALRAPWHWTGLESAQYAGLRDHLTLQVVMDSLIARVRPEAGAGASMESLGIAAREKAMASLAVSFDPVVVERLARVFSRLPRPESHMSMARQLQVMATPPAVEPGDSGLVLATSSIGPYRVSGLLEGWRRLNPIYRPRVDTPSQMRDLAKNGLLERWVRGEAARLELERRPDIAAALEQKREYFAVTHFVSSQVYEGIPADSVALLAYYRAHPDDWNLPERASVIRLTLPDRASASDMAVRLQSTAGAETLAARGERSGVSYREEIGVASDSALFREAQRFGPGAVVGPDSTADGWTVARVEALIPTRARTFEEARPLVEHRWYAEEGERRMRATLDRLRHRTRVVVNRRAVDRVGRGPAPEAAP